MAEIKKTLSKKEANEALEKVSIDMSDAAKKKLKETDEALKKTTEKMRDIFKAFDLRLPEPLAFDSKNFIAEMPPIGPTLLDSILEALVKSGKSTEESSQKIIKLTAKIKTLTWCLVGLAFLTIVLMIFSFLKR